MEPRVQILGARNFKLSGLLMAPDIEQIARSADAERLEAERANKDGAFQFGFDFTCADIVGFKPVRVFALVEELLLRSPRCHVKLTFSSTHKEVLDLGEWKDGITGGDRCLVDFAAGDSVSESLESFLRDIDEPGWTEQKNIRRCALIDQMVEGTLNSGEGDELAKLQRELHDHLDEQAPLSLERLQELHASLSEGYPSRGDEGA